MSNFSIKLKLILLFILIKIIPLLLIVLIAYNGIKFASNYMNESARYLSNQTSEVIISTADLSIANSIKSLDDKSQKALEKHTLSIANQIADFLRQRDKDILFLSKLELSEDLFKNFYLNNTRKIIFQEQYTYNEQKALWNSNNIPRINENMPFDILDDNKRKFTYYKKTHLNQKELPIYKEITFFDLDGLELLKYSNIKEEKSDISKKINTYIKSEDYFSKIHNLKEGEIYVSEVIGEYVPSKVIGIYNKPKVKTLNIEFEPQNSAYAGKENPLGKRFEGIIRFITPIFKESKKIGFLSLALDHRHIMEFTDNIDPMGIYLKENIIDAGTGNYAFAFDNQGRNISHVRDYFISGFDKNTGKRVTPWVSSDIQKMYDISGLKDFDAFVRSYDKFHNPSLKKTSNKVQLKQGLIPVECAYLNFAPHCKGWMDLTKDGGHGSFVIFWSGVWKLVTAATIPYYTGENNSSKRGFGFVTMGANIEDFHSAANKTKDEIKVLLEEQKTLIDDIIIENEKELDKRITDIINELTLSSIFMILLIITIAIWMSNYISSKIEKLLLGTKKFSMNDFDYRIKVSSNDEIGKLEDSFNEMASKISSLVNEQKNLNENLESKVEEKTKELILINEQLEQKIKEEVNKNRQKDVHLIQSSKMASMGEMLSMIIHQWKQPLNTISILNSSLKLKNDLQILEETEIVDCNKAISKQIEQMNSTMNDFRDFFKVKNKKTYCVNLMLQKALHLVSDIFAKQTIEIRLFNNERKVYTSGFENEIIQVIINILNNARDEILNNNETLKRIDIKLKSNEENVCIYINDFAGGIKEKYLDEVFKAYFTTKDEDNGTGLGLYMSKVILKKVNADIEVFNEDYIINNNAYKGACFKILLKKDNNG